MSASSVEEREGRSVKSKVRGCRWRAEEGAIPAVAKWRGGGSESLQGGTRKRGRRPSLGSSARFFFPESARTGYRSRWLYSSQVEYFRLRIPTSRSCEKDAIGTTSRGGPPQACPLLRRS